MSICSQLCTLLPLLGKRVFVSTKMLDELSNLPSRKGRLSHVIVYKLFLLPKSPFIVTLDEQDLVTDKLQILSSQVFVWHLSVLLERCLRCCFRLFFKSIFGRDTCDMALITWCINGGITTPIGQQVNALIGYLL